MDFSKMTDAELKELNKALEAETIRRRRVERDLAREELEKLIDRINELQDSYDFRISCCDEEGDWIGYAQSFELNE